MENQNGSKIKVVLYAFDQIEIVIIGVLLKSE